MAVSFKFWDDCVDPEDMEELWMDPEVSKEWIDVGETKGQKVHLLRDPDGQPYLTQTEMKAVAGIICRRHFKAQIDVDMICAIAEIGSGRHLLAERYHRKTKETTIGLMQLLPEAAEWLFREMGYRIYEIEGNPTLLYRPFISVYLGAAYIKYLSGFEGKERSEEFVVRSYNGGTKKATHKSTLDCWQHYLSAKESLPSKREPQISDNHAMLAHAPGPPAHVSSKAGDAWTYWDTRASPEDMEEMWKHPDVLKEWTESGERRGKVRFSHDTEKRPYLSRAEVKTVLAAIAELRSMRFVNGVGPHSGIMGIEYPLALWLYKDLGYKAYKVTSVEDLSHPFISMYFGAAYLNWLSEYEGRQRTHQFIVQAYLGGGPEKVNLQETGPYWTKFQEALCYYEDPKKEQWSCSIL
ncbi:uncharacterized protein LOC131242152 isoform X2 [Magnolia sinica]|uniref:uncharacterized protein LOC131242152 isoform X2 n=1 Tax=Magnolia sinica TaxID=86752 RepID=UPI002658A03D|nr:uncharacterized protein LOC131242152 isoform X2 [Magnolia sinica]